MRALHEGETMMPGVFFFPTFQFRVQEGEQKGLP